MDLFCVNWGQIPAQTVTAGLYATLTGPAGTTRYALVLTKQVPKDRRDRHFRARTRQVNFVDPAGMPHPPGTRTRQPPWDPSQTTASLTRARRLCQAESPTRREALLCPRAPFTSHFHFSHCLPVHPRRHRVSSTSTAPFRASSRGSAGSFMLWVCFTVQRDLYDQHICHGRVHRPRQPDNLNQQRHGRKHFT